ncbi:MAG: hypothetical protein PHT32_04185, partial [Candidatus Omnitrophica bacterium]|nr:hypothetical protein [Candidatus Omnitrophota bacterium]
TGDPEEYTLYGSNGEVVKTFYQPVEGGSEWKLTIGGSNYTVSHEEFTGEIVLTEDRISSEGVQVKTYTQKDMQEATLAEIKDDEATQERIKQRPPVWEEDYVFYTERRTYYEIEEKNTPAGTPPRKGMVRTEAADQHGVAVSFANSVKMNGVYYDMFMAGDTIYVAFDAYNRLSVLPDTSDYVTIKVDAGTDKVTLDGQEYRVMRLVDAGTGNVTIAFELVRDVSTSAPGFMINDTLFNKAVSAVTLTEEMSAGGYFDAMRSSLDSENQAKFDNIMANLSGYTGTGTIRDKVVAVFGGRVTALETALKSALPHFGKFFTVGRSESSESVTIGKVRDWLAGINLYGASYFPEKYDSNPFTGTVTFKNGFTYDMVYDLNDPSKVRLVHSSINSYRVADIAVAGTSYITNYLGDGHFELKEAYTPYGTVYRSFYDAAAGQEVITLPTGTFAINVAPGTDTISTLTKRDRNTSQVLYDKRLFELNGKTYQITDRLMSNTHIIANYFDDKDQVESYIDETSGDEYVNIGAYKYRLVQDGITMTPASGQVSIGSVMYAVSYSTVSKGWTLTDNRIPASPVIISIVNGLKKVTVNSVIYNVYGKGNTLTLKKQGGAITLEESYTEFKIDGDKVGTLDFGQTDVTKPMTGVVFNGRLYEVTQSGDGSGNIFVTFRYGDAVGGAANLKLYTSTAAKPKNNIYASTIRIDNKTYQIKMDLTSHDIILVTPHAETQKTYAISVGTGGKRYAVRDADPVLDGTDANVYYITTVYGTRKTYATDPATNTVKLDDGLIYRVSVNPDGTIALVEDKTESRIFKAVKIGDTICTLTTDPDDPKHSVVVDDGYGQYKSVQDTYGFYNDGSVVYSREYGEDTENAAEKENPEGYGDLFGSGNQKFSHNEINYRVTVQEADLYDIGVFAKTWEGMKEPVRDNYTISYTFKVWVDGFEKGTFTVWADEREYQAGSLPLILGKGEHAIKLEWLPDQSGGVSGERSVELKDVFVQKHSERIADLNNDLVVNGEDLAILQGSLPITTPETALSVSIAEGALSINGQLYYYYHEGVVPNRKLVVANGTTAPWVEGADSIININGIDYEISSKQVNIQGTVKTVYLLTEKISSTPTGDKVIEANGVFYNIEWLRESHAVTFTWRENGVLQSPVTIQLDTNKEVVLNGVLYTVDYDIAANFIQLTEIVHEAKILYETTIDVRGRLYTVTHFSDGSLELRNGNLSERINIPKGTTTVTLEGVIYSISFDSSDKLILTPVDKVIESETPQDISIDIAELDVSDMDVNPPKVSLTGSSLATQVYRITIDPISSRFRFTNMSNPLDDTNVLDENNRVVLAGGVRYAAHYTTAGANQFLLVGKEYKRLTYEAGSTVALQGPDGTTKAYTVTKTLIPGTAAFKYVFTSGTISYETVDGVLSIGTGDQTRYIVNVVGDDMLIARECETFTAFTATTVTAHNVTLDLPQGGTSQFDISIIDQGQGIYRLSGNEGVYTTADGRFSLGSIVYQITQKNNDITVSKNSAAIQYDPAITVARLQTNSRQISTYQVTENQGVYTLTNTDPDRSNDTGQIVDGKVTLDGVTYNVHFAGGSMNITKDYMILDNGDGTYTFGSRQDVEPFTTTSTDGTITLTEYTPQGIPVQKQYYIFKNPITGVVMLLQDKVVHSTYIGSSALAIKIGAGTTFYDVVQSGPDTYVFTSNTQPSAVYTSTGNTVMINDVRYQITKTGQNLVLEAVPFESVSGANGIVRLALDGTNRYYEVVRNGSTKTMTFTNLKDPADTASSTIVGGVHTVTFASQGNAVYTVGGDIETGRIFLTPKPIASENIARQAIIVRTPEIRRYDTTFASGNTGWSTVTGAWTTAGGYYIPASTTVNSMAILNPALYECGEEFTVSADVMFNNSTASLIGQYYRDDVDPAVYHYYEVEFNSSLNQVNFKKVVNGVWTVVKTSAIPSTIGTLANNQLYKIVMRMQGSALHAYIALIDPGNRDVFTLTEVGTVTVDSFGGTGTVGIGAGLTGNTKFENVKTVASKEDRTYYSVYKNPSDDYVFDDGTGGVQPVAQNENAYVILKSVKYLISFDGDNNIVLAKDSTALTFDLSDVDTPAGSGAYTTSENGSWMTQTATYYGTADTFAAETGMVLPGASSYLERTVNVDEGGGLLTFHWKVGTDGSYSTVDTMRLIIDGVDTPYSINANSGWQNVSVPLDFGMHTIQWVYDRTLNTDTTQSANNFAWVDSVEVISHRINTISSAKLPIPQGSYTTDGWFVQNIDTPATTGWAAKAKAVYSTNTRMSKTIDLANADSDVTLGFDWKLAVGTAKTFKIFINGADAGLDSGAWARNEWHTFTKTLAKGSVYTVEWVYQDDAQAGNDNETACLANVRFDGKDNTEDFSYEPGVIGGYTSSGVSLWSRTFRDGTNACVQAGKVYNG